ncbi:hypothetical protein BK120_07550 [Paenibacillus sp. FSL A5-0031]|uniref:hypothetical protein n=1 Tax=Paenibacillus sp. FSL A5-0031 TaxID=1920420 RepID=UPI00096BEB9A|nr:hypothetical protein [Paenibacillus sp. FSL A5-0031]OME86777.1 hypothetical protein BK120_07550 [Paenibacillus sp. FSL A5-0031]
MKRNALKWTVLGGALAIIIMYGIDMSSSGIERIYGPIEGSSGYTEIPQTEQNVQPVNDFQKEQQQKIAQLEQELKELKRLAAYDGDTTGETAETFPAENERMPGLPLKSDQPAVNKIADSTSGLLQNMSSEGIRMVVSIFDGLTK